MSESSPKVLATLHPQMVGYLESLVLLPMLKKLPFGTWAANLESNGLSLSAITIYDSKFIVVLEPVWSADYGCLRWLKYRNENPESWVAILNVLARVKRSGEIVATVPLQAFSFPALLKKVQMATLEAGRL